MARPRRVRLRRVRQWIDNAAMEIAASPDEWPAIVNGVRSALGRGPLSRESVAALHLRYAPLVAGVVSGAVTVPFSLVGQVMLIVGESTSTTSNEC